MEQINIAFFSWTELASCAGALVMVSVITQFTKNCPFVKKMPTQLWSYVVALLVLYPAYLFTNQLTVDNAFLIPLNSVLISLASNGGFHAVEKMMDTDKNS